MYRNPAGLGLVGWLTLATLLGGQVAMASPFPMSPPTAEYREFLKKTAKPADRKILDNYRSTFIVDPDNYPAEPTGESFQKSLENLRSGAVESLEVIFNLNEYYNTKVNLENGMALIEEDPTRLQATQKDENSAVQCQLYHEDTGQPCKEFLAVIYRQPGYAPINLLEGFSREKRAAVEKENEERKARNEARRAKVGDANYEKLKIVPGTEFGMTWWDFVYSLDKVKTDNEKIMVEKWDLTPDEWSLRATVITAGSTLLLAWLLKGDKNTLKISESKLGKAVAERVAAKTKAAKEALGKLAGKLKRNKVEFDVSNKIKEEDIKVVLSNAITSKLVGSLPAATEATREPILDRIPSLINIVMRKNAVTRGVTSVSKSWNEFVRNHFIVGGTIHVGLSTLAAKAEMRVFADYGAEVNSRMYIHQLLTLAFNDAIRKNGTIELVGAGQGKDYLPATDKIQRMSAKELEELTAKQLKDAAQDMSGGAQDGKAIVADAVGKDVANAAAKAPGDTIANVPEVLRITKTDKPIAAARMAFVEFLTKYKKKAVKVQAEE